MRPVEGLWALGPLMMVCCAGSVEFRVEEGQNGRKANKPSIVPIDPVVLKVQDGSARRGFVDVHPHC